MNSVKYDMSIFTSNLQKYIEVSGKQQKEIAQELGVGQSTFCDWVKGKIFPRIDKLKALADYFDVKMSDLIEVRTLPVERISKEQQEVLNLYGSLSASEKELFMKLIKSVKS